MFPKQGKRKTKSEGLPALDRKLWRLFSAFIRHRDCPGGWGVCVTCGKPKPYADLDAGHFVGRRYKATKFDERNVAIQCRSCNRFNSGESYAFGVWIDKKYGAGTAESLYNLSRMRGTKLDRLWYCEKIKEYTQKLKGLK